MAKAFFGSKISNNMTKTPEGFLICHNVPIARTGWYEYLESELKDNGSPTETIQVYRGPNEVFSSAAIASFEGKPVTDEHPPEMVVTPDTSKKYTEGAAQNVRRSTEEKDLLIADLIIYDQELIKQVEDGKREISCGYECDYVVAEGTYCQTNIRGNHIAVVDAGRAGHRVRIKDSEIKNKNNIYSKGDKKSMSKTLKNLTKKKERPVSKFLTAVGLKHIATDAEPEDIADVVDALSEENANDEEEEVSPSATQADGEEGKENDVMAAVNALAEQVSALSQTVTALANQEKKEHTSDEIIDDMINELGGDNTNDEEQDQCDEDQIDEEESVTIPVENIDEDTVENDEEEESKISNDTAVKIAALNAIKPVIAQIKDPVQRKKACDSLKKQFLGTKQKKKKNVDGYSKIMNTKRNSAKQRMNNDARTNSNVQEIGDSIYSKFNANAPKGGNQ
ncbi:DUF2213 domain-containing protein [Clostridium butyricum]|uniref:DUF2213 domain-containing protein n=1 Tax=Clostridium butyricum TaxID=1492 RepID=UPI0022E4D973|nr:DUF2213 domain-containing protein [Clostridium butyricum]